MEKEMIAQLAQQGGFAALAGVALLLIYKLALAWNADGRDAREREREARQSAEELHSRTLDILSGLKEALATLAAEVRIERRGGSDRRGGP